MTNSFGLLGVSLVVLSIIGYTDNTALVLGGIMVVLDLFLSRMYYRDIHNIQSILLAFIQYLDIADETTDFAEEEEESSGL